MVGEPDDIEIHDLVFDDLVVAHLARHGIVPNDILEVFNNAPRYFRNLPGRGGTHVMIGPDLRGRFLYVSIFESSVPGTWRAVTGLGDEPIAGVANLWGRWTVRNLEDMVREAEAVKDTEAEIEGLVPVKARASKKRGAVYSLRLSVDDFLTISRAAEARGVSMSAFLREAGLALARGEIAPDAAERAGKLSEVRQKAEELAEALRQL